MGMGAPLCSDAHCAMTMLAGAERRGGSADRQPVIEWLYEGKIRQGLGETRYR